MPTHPDYLGGLGFLPGVQERFGVLFTALGSVIAGQIANDIVYEGQRLAASKVLIFAFVVIAVLIVLSPLLVFTQKLYRLKRAGLADYGRLASQHMQEFDQKWVRDRPDGESLLGTPDISSQADMVWIIPSSTRCESSQSIRWSSCKSPYSRPCPWFPLY
jgi:hypothetical protein